jgi:hypothetical protein
MHADGLSAPAQARREQGDEEATEDAHIITVYLGKSAAMLSAQADYYVNQHP